MLNVSSISKGVEVLSRVNDDINCLFLHLWENPRLCGRTAMEMVSMDESNRSRSTNPTAGSGGGKREQASAHKGKDSRVSEESILPKCSDARQTSPLWC
jgi:hypothetical protein